MSWNSIIGQKRVKDILHSALVRNRLAHAYLFSGPQGVGKDATAIELAKVLNCERADVEACDTCPSCMKLDKLQHPNVNLIIALPVGKNEKYGDSPLSKLADDDVAFIQQQLQQKADNLFHKISIPRANSIKINSIREIRKESSLTAFERGKKVFIIIDAENLSDESSNALLKTLEEPHENTLLILTTSQPDSLLPTILSRCQHIRFDLLTTDEIRSALFEREHVEAMKAELIAQLSHGSYSRALELTDSTPEEYRSEAVAFLRIALYKSRQELLQEIDRIFSEYQKGEVEEFLRHLQSWFHTAMTFKEQDERISSLVDSETIRKFIKHHQTLDYSVLFDIMERAISLLNKNVYIPLILLNLAIELQKNILASGLHQESKPIRTGLA
jgi:DNA polymerase-3 subunit delta'